MIDPADTHYRRALDYLEDARNAASPEDKSRYLASSVENAVAIVEAFLGQVQDRERVRQLAWQSLPRYRLLKRVRIHEFHRCPLPVFPPEWRGKVRFLAMQGPITLSTGPGPGSAAMVGTRFITTGSGKVDRTGGRGGGRGNEKELWICNGELRDEFANDWIDLHAALEQYLAKVPDFIKAASRLP